MFAGLPTSRPCGQPAPLSKLAAVLAQTLDRACLRLSFGRIEMWLRSRGRNLRRHEGQFRDGARRLNRDLTLAPDRQGQSTAILARCDYSKPTGTDWSESHAYQPRNRRAP